MLSKIYRMIYKLNVSTTKTVASFTMQLIQNNAKIFQIISQTHLKYSIF